MNELKAGGVFHTTCYDKDRNILWEDTSKNLVVNEGLYHILDALFSVEVANPMYYVGLLASDPVIAGSDTLLSHEGWTEVLTYNEGDRQIYVNARTENKVSNEVSKATFSINAPATIGGTFLASVEQGTAGMLLSASEFSTGDKTLSAGQTLETQYIFTVASN